MKLEMSRKELKDELYPMDLEQIITYFEAKGLKLKPELNNPPIGIYRRVGGMDMLHYDGVEWTKVMYGNREWESDDEIVWSLSSGEEEWKLVLDEWGGPTDDGHLVSFNREGKRTA